MATPSPKLCPNGCGEPGPHFAPPCMGEPGFYTCTPRIRDHDMELAMRPLPDGWEDAMRTRLADNAAPRVLSIGNPMPANDFHQRVTEAGRAAAVAGVPYPTFREPTDPGVMTVPTVRASEATSMADLFGDTLGDLRYRDATSPTDAARAKARKRRKRKR